MWVSNKFPTKEARSCLSSPKGNPDFSFWGTKQLVKISSSLMNYSRYGPLSRQLELTFFCIWRRKTQPEQIFMKYLKNQKSWSTKHFHQQQMTRSQTCYLLHRWEALFFFTCTMCAFVCDTHFKINTLYLLLLCGPGSNRYVPNLLHVRLLLDTGILKWK